MRRNKLWNIRFVHLLLVEAVFQFATYLLNPVISSYVVLLGSSLAVGGFVAGLVAGSLRGWWRRRRWPCARSRGGSPTS